MTQAQALESKPYKKPVRKIIYPYLFIMPFALLVLVFFVLPAIATVGMAFTDLNASMKPHFIGLSNFKRIMTDYNLPQILGNTAVFAILTLVISLLFALVIAIATQYFLKGKVTAVIYRVLWLIPSIIPSVVYVTFWKFIFDPTEGGLINEFLQNMGIISEPVSWFTKGAMAIVILATIVSTVSGGMILLSSAINSIPEDLYKAARVDGASEKSVILKIILPTLKWPLMYITISDLIGFVSSYFFIMLLTNGGPMRDTTTLSLYAFQQAFNLKYYGYGAAVSLIVVFISFVLTLLLIRLFDFDQMIKPSRIED
ncbi:carbohydrate ABC transporter permease [Paenibacillus sp. CF384]|uniref:carbohydrate ABC transporter permease n=1 Tax=Paenibacillus sp. CF384 TaxID=1884382 RepID=UPI000895E69B|nr:sugar ABC transporter permease [Paenibacillus sp. CF384]SDW44070.1 carbohydrate ABC transporter membrane protein 1, CUT1 family [Paenibacillus sp. CF384]